ncbi:ATP-binding protein [Kitasatospora sp. NBC_01302]|uniref:ATP-binding protein n=1 Tax=Kitasatospora sp. NBC_01302 TaxID=2903575 RepID=UPI002E15F12E|nr:ATP-binding protein [Kitasatospora sp. NBC_01302]
MTIAALPTPLTFDVVAGITDPSGKTPVQAARDRIADTATGWGVPLSRAALADVRLCASEIITNALIHAAGHCTVSVTWTGEHLRVDVTDRSIRVPVLTSSDTSARSGRGLALVEALAHSWGWEPKQRGKVVHFLVAADAAIAGEPRLSVLLHTARARAEPVPA